MTEHASLELSRKLHDVGVRFESKSHWAYSASGWNREGVRYHDDYGKPKINGNQFPAYTLAEIWPMLPDELKNGGGLYQWKNDINTVVGYLIHNHGGTGMAFAMNATIPIYQAHEIPVEAAGNMLLWLAENDYLEVTP